ncbi:MAG: hypothetical protein WC759_05535 [Candidatus Micrarchaeia archaeon]|jgi:hypothetical protein
MENEMRLTQMELKEVLEHQHQYDYRAHAGSQFAELPESEWWKEVRQAAEFRRQLDEREAA